jgi:dTDP-4-amino-4,6-dideoxygalactose transaminase
MHELEAAIGRVQLGKLDAIMARRRAVLALVHEGMRNLEAIRPVRPLDGVEINPWSALFLLDLDRLAVDNATYAAALVAEGLPVSHSYRNAITYELEVFRSLKTYGRSHFPYGYELGGRRIEWRPPDNPTVERIARSLLLVNLHEDWTEREAGDTVAALHKVEAAYLR